MPDRSKDPCLLVCGFGAFPGVPDNPAALVTERLRHQAWAPEDCGVAYAVLPTTWARALETCAEALRDSGAAGVLLLGVATRAESFRVEMRARNRACTDKTDAAGLLYRRPRISPLGPAVARASAPVEPLVTALHKAGLSAYASSDAGDYLCNYTFYRLLTEIVADPNAPLAAFVHIPPAHETDPAAALGLDDLERGVKAVASAFARTLVFGPRAEPVIA